MTAGCSEDQRFLRINFKAYAIQGMSELFRFLFNILLSRNLNDTATLLRGQWKKMQAQGSSPLHIPERFHGEEVILVSSCFITFE